MEGNSQGSNSLKQLVYCRLCISVDLNRGKHSQHFVAGFFQAVFSGCFFRLFICKLFLQAGFASSFCQQFLQASSCKLLLFYKLCRMARQPASMA